MCTKSWSENEGRDQEGGLRHTWEDNIKMNLKEIVGESVELIYPAQDKDRWRALVNTEMNLRVP
jgi:hypothetical protein